MAKKANDGTFFMALEAGAPWPEHLTDLKESEDNFQALVQGNGETAEHFAGRTLQRWHRLLDCSAPPHRFMLGIGPNAGSHSLAARARIAHGVFEASIPGPAELILWSGAGAGTSEQGRLLELAGRLVEHHRSPDRSVRVLFGDPSPSVGARYARPRVVGARRPHLFGARPTSLESPRAIGC